MAVTANGKQASASEQRGMQPADAAGQRSPARHARTLRDIKQAMVALLENKRLDQITMSELAREAQISRSTLYNHYDNVMDVYESILQDFWDQTSPILGAINSPDEEISLHHRPFCHNLRSSDGFHSVISEQAFIDSLLAHPEYLESHDLYTVLRDHGYSEDQAKALCAFQLTGCYVISQLSLDNESQWESIRAIVDRFIAGGIEACLER